MKRTTTIEKLGQLTSIGLVICLPYAVAAQDSHWDGSTTNTLWNNPNNWSPDGVPPSVAAGLDPVNGGNVWLDPANGDTVITIPAGDTESPGVGGANPPFNTIFGPEFGVTLNIYGSLNYDWTLAPYSPDPANRSHINMYTNSTMTTTGASINLGDAWWSGPQFGNHTTMNMYANAQFQSLGGAGMWFGAHLNIYDTASFLANGYINMDTAFGESDGTRSIVMGGGTFMAPENTINGGGNSGSVSNWVTRGIMRAYGKGFDQTDLVVSDNGTNTIVTTVPLGGALERVYFQPVLKSDAPPGTVQQLVLAGDYPAVSGVYLSSSEPGVDPATFPAPSYSSSNPNVISVDSFGVATAVGVGTATISATVGSFNSTNTVTINVAGNTAAMVHRYSFNENGGGTTADSIGGADYAATLVGGATLAGGQVSLDGSTGYVQLPSGILTNMDEVTIEAWASFGTPVNTFANLFCFGYADQSGDGNDGYGGDYVNVQMNNGGNKTTQISFGQGLPGFNGEWNAVAQETLDGMTNAHVVAVLHPYAGNLSLYINGTLAATQSMFNTLLDPVAFNGPIYQGQSILARTMNGQTLADDNGAGIPDPNNYIGWDDYQGNANSQNPPTINPDPTLNGSVNEFRIYNGALNAAQIAADFALGPDQVIGSSKSVSLTATISGGKTVISWPTSSAYVTLVSSPVLGAGAVWTPVANGTLAVVGGNYQETVSVSGTTAFFALQ